MKYAVVFASSEWVSRVVGPFESEREAEQFIETGITFRDGKRYVIASENPHHWRADGSVIELEDPATADDGGQYERIQELKREEQKKRDLKAAFNDG